VARRSPFARLMPPRSSLALAAAIATVAGIAYVAARETSIFAIRAVEVAGAPPAVAAQARVASRGFLGESLVALDDGEVLRRVRAVPTVASARLDRAFPNTLALTVVAERPAAVVRRGADAWLVAASGRVLRLLAPGARPPLVRVWVPAATDVRIGSHLAGSAARAVAAIAPIVDTPFAARVRTARAEADHVTLELRSGVEVRLGDLSQLDLKLAVARQIVGAHGAPLRGYVDVSVPERPVATNPQVGG
jgi:cell division protein FtsQ